jgi:predicted PurR-regulated permease PerM/methanogenic corrinoid protein MtbC1
MIKPGRPSDSSSVRTIGILIAVIAVLYLAREIFIPLAFAITLTLILTPAVAWLQKIHLGRVPSVFLVMTVSIAVAGGIGWVIFNQLLDVANELPSYQENIHSKIQAMRAPSKNALGRAADTVKELGKELATVQAPTPPPAHNESVGRRAAQNQVSRPLQVQIVDDPSNEFQYLRDLTKPFLAPLGVFGVVLIFTVFLLIEQDDLRNRLFRLAGLDQLNVMTQALEDATQRVSRYLMLQLLVNSCFGLLCAAGLYLIGVPYALLWGAVAGILRIVPYVGSLVAALLPLVLSLAVFDNWRPPVLVFVLFATLEMATGNFIEPWLYGTHTGISSLALLLTTVFWTVLWGPAGLILSTPLTVCVVVLGRHAPQFSFLHILLGDEAVLAAEAQVYQRLLAMDDQQARAVADLYLTENSLVQLYDSVLIPALTMAEQDRHKGALDKTREEFLFLSMKEMLAEFSEQTLKVEPAERSPAASAGRVICLPASDEADEITAAMLAQLMEQAGCAALAFPLDSTLHESIGLVEPDEKDIFFVSALPPFAFVRARTLGRRLQSRFPRTKLVIGVWGFTGDMEKALQRFQPLHPDRLVTTLADAVNFVVPAVQATLVTESYTDEQSQMNA